MAKANRSTSSKIDDDFALKMYRKIRRAPALLTKEQVSDCEKTATQRDWVRRATWCLLTMSGKELIDKIKNDREAAVGCAMAYRAMSDYKKNLDEIARFVGCAEVRMMIALAGREDMQAVLSEAKLSEAKV